MSKLSIYLAGAIRDNNIQDIIWREQAIQAFGDRIIVLNPLGGKVKDSAGLWTVCGVPSDSHLIVRQDFWMVDKADIILANFSSLSEGYPTIGTLTEWGRSTVASKLRYAIWPKDFTGHGNTAMYGVHPFIAQFAAKLFDSVIAAIDFLDEYIDILNGVRANYGGKKE